MGRRWTAHEERRLADAYAAGVPVKDMARLLERSLAAVENALYRLRIVARRRRWTEADLADLGRGVAVAGRSPLALRVRRCRDRRPPRP